MAFFSLTKKVYYRSDYFVQEIKQNPLKVTRYKIHEIVRVKGLLKTWQNSFEDKFLSKLTKEKCKATSSRVLHQTPRPKFISHKGWSS